MTWQLSRREFSAVIGAALASGIKIPRALWSQVRQQSAIFSWTSINESLHVALGAGGNSLVVKGPESSALVDTKFLGMGPFLAEQARDAAEGDVAFVFNTHHHGDHSGGNNSFVESQLITHANAVPRIAQATQRGIDGIGQDSEGWLNQAVAFWEIELSAEERAELVEFAANVATLDPSDFAPDQTFETRLEHTDTGIEMQWRHVAAGHTDNDSFLFLPEFNVLHAGDLLFFGRHPFMRASDGGTTVGWQRSLAAATGTCDDDTVVIPGHGPITNKQALRDQSRYFDRLRDLVITEMSEGKPRDSIVDLRIPEFSDLQWGNILPGTLGVIYDELNG